MIRFLMNLFKIGRKKQEKKKHQERRVFEEDDMLIEIDMDKGSMVITTDKELTGEEIFKLFKKYAGGS